MDWGHIFLVGAISLVSILNLALLREAFRQKRRGGIAETLLTVGFTQCLILSFVPSFAHGVGSILGYVAVALGLVSLVVSLTRRRRASGAKPEPPAA